MKSDKPNHLTLTRQSLFTLESGGEDFATAKVNKFGRTGLPTLGFGLIITHTDKASSSMWMAISMKENGVETRPTG